MKTVARLVLTFFVGTRETRWLTISGLLLILASLYVVLYLPQTEHMAALAVPGVIVFFFGTALMPLMVGRLSQGHAARILPALRVKLLASATLTLLLAALPVGLMTPIIYVAGMSAHLSELRDNPQLFDYTLWLALYTYSSAIIAAFWLYVFMWFVTSERGLAGYAKAMAVLLALVLLPGSGDETDGERLQTNLEQLAVVFVVFSVGFLAWPRLTTWFRSRGRAQAREHDAATREFAGKEIDLLLGNARPWILIIVLLLPLAITARMGVAPALWVLYLTIASIVAGGNSERAPVRSRGLWLLGGWTRPMLFTTVERSAWRHNGLVMVALLLFLLGIGSYTKMPAAQMATAIPLILLGTALSTYLGLSLTRGVRVPEALLGSAVMMTLVVIAVMAASGKAAPWWIAGPLIALAALVITLRWVARARWERIDWSQCRNDAQRGARAG